MTGRRSLLIVLVALVASAVLALPVPMETSANVLPALAFTIFTIGLWATGALPEHITAVAFFVIALGFSVAPPEIVFSGLRSSAFWLIFGGVVIGIVAECTGLGRYLAHFFTRRLDTSYPQLITGIVVGAVALAFLIPSAMGRLVILMPIILGLADNLGLEPGSKGRTGMALAATFGTFYVPLTILPANLPNVVLAGVSDTLYELSITYGVYLLMNFPVTGVIKGGFLVAMICFMFRDEIPKAPERKSEPLKLDSDGRRLMMIVNGFSTLFLPYQSAPIMVGLRLSNVSLATAARVMLPLAVITIVLLLLLNFLWWQWLGYLP